MENASKALIIAGAILLSILIIALGIYVFNMAKGATNTDQLDTVQKQSFNSQFTQYKGQVKGGTVQELINLVMSNNTKYKDSVDRIVNLIYVETRSGNTAVRSGIGWQPDSFDFDNATRVRADGSNFNAKSIASEAGCASTGNDTGSFMSFYGTSGRDDYMTESFRVTGKLGGQITAQHTYKVGYCINPETGLVDFVVIKY